MALEKLPLPLAVLLLATAAGADVVPPPPEECPPGHTPSTGHGGPFCAPSVPTSCPPGYLPSVHHTTAYCEPPPAEPCPPGSDWGSQGPHDSFCQAGPACDYCGPDETCVPTSFCLDWTCFRCSMTRIVATCNSDADCPKQKDSFDDRSLAPTCIRQYRCEPRNKRAPADYRPVPRDKAPAPIELGVRPERELPSCAFQSCPAGQLCLPMSLCTAGDREPEPGVTPVVASCEHGASCPDKSICTRSFRCVDPWALHPTQDGKPVTKQPVQTARLPRGEGKGGPSDGSRGGCASCAIVGPDGPLMWLAGLAVAVGLLLRRRRRR